MKKRMLLLKEFIKLKHYGYTKEDRMLRYAIKGLISFEDFNNYYDNKILKKGKHAK